MNNRGKIAALLLLAATTACNSIQATDTVSSAEKPTVVVSNSILCDLTETIADSTIALNCLIDPDQDPHTFNATPSQREAVETAELILYSGYGLTPAVEKLIAASTTDAPKVAVSEMAVEDPIVDQAVDPHVWHDVQNAIAMTEVINQQLKQINPDAAAEYDQNTQQLQQQLQELDEWIKTQIATIPSDQRILVTSHDAFNYYVQAYGLDQSSAIAGISSETKPTASRIKELVTEIKSTNVPTIFVEATGNDRIINTVAREAGVQVADESLLADSLGDSDSYIAMMQHNTCAITVGLGGECQIINISAIYL